MSKIPSHLEYTLMYFNSPIKQIDIDYIIIYDQEINISETLETNIAGNTLNATLISPKYFQKLIDANDIKAIECLFLKSDKTKDGWSFESVDFEFNIDPIKLRHSISSVASNSWVKCKKKLEQGDILIGQKSLFHSLRIIDFGIQVMKYGKIEFEKPKSDTLSNYLTNMELLSTIKIISKWEILKDEYKPIYNSIRTEFKLLTPKK